MAFLRSGFSRIGGSGDSGTVWKYASTDSIATALGANYFLPAIGEIAVNDVVMVSDSDGTAAVTISFCKANNGSTTITMASGTALGDA
jgi:hypothetical protein